jgi:acetyl esterase/lipase
MTDTPSSALGSEHKSAVTPDHKNLAYTKSGHPLIIWIHGGAWQVGNKSDGVPFEYVGYGYALASINYRLSQYGLFPAQIEDCKAAVRWLRGNAARYNLDPHRFAAWGPSAGGHLAAMLGTAAGTRRFDVGENLTVSSSVWAVVDYFGPTNFIQMDAHRLPDGQVHDGPESPESQLVGGPIQDHPDRVALANPVTYVTPACPPFLIIHGELDPLVPHHQSVLLVNALEREGVPVTFYTVNGGGHGGFTDPRVEELTRSFLERHLGASR